MCKKRNLLTLLVFSFLATVCQSGMEQDFKDPPRKYGPMPFWFLNGTLTTEGIREQMEAANESGFTGVTPLPTMWKSDERPGTTPLFLTPEYFDRLQDIIDMAVELDMKVILYDDNDYPSGMAGGKLGELYPQHTMKRLDIVETEFTGPGTFTQSFDAIELMAAVAMNMKTKERIEISDFAEGGTLTWEAPKGTWTIMLFPLVRDGWHTPAPVVDYLDPVAVKKKMEFTYDVYAEKLSAYFGNTIQKTFFDDVGFWLFPRSWTARFNEAFEALYGYDPKPYYPALWHDIGPETESIRNAFFNTRAEMLAESYPRLVAEWNERHGLKSMGHPPGNYDPTPVDMNGDIFKFYRYTQIPLADVILNYQFGQNGHKLISSAADYYDRPIVGVEIFGAFRRRDVHFDKAMLYRPMFETFARGINFVVPHAMWYNPQNRIIEPLVSSGNPEIADELPAFSKFVSRASLLLQGGRRVSEIGVLYPIEELSGFYNFGKPEGVRQGFYISPETDYQKISGILSNDIRRDFTFVHPEFFLGDKYVIGDASVKLQNAENYQEYKVMFLTGSNVISYRTLGKLKEFYEAGGTIISTTQLPSKSSERGADHQVLEWVEAIFGQHPGEIDGSAILRHSNVNGGLAVHLPNPTKETIQEVLDERMQVNVRFSPNPVLKTDWGKFNYIHKFRDGQHIYMFTNSSDEFIATDVILRGDLSLEKWNPHTGVVEREVISEKFVENGETFTKLKLSLDPVRSLFFVSSN